MDDRGYVAQALFDRLDAEGLRFSVLGDTRGYPDSAPPEVDIAVEPLLLPRVPSLLARFAQDFDLQLVELERPAYRAWRSTLAWSDELGRPRFVATRICGGYYAGARLLLGAEELLDAAPAAGFIHGLLEGIRRGELEGQWLSALWQEDPRGGIEYLARFWRRPAQLRLIAQAAKHGDWRPVQRAIPLLRRALARAPALRLDALFGHAGLAARRLLERRLLVDRRSIAFTGRESIARAGVLAQVARDLGPLGLELFEDRPGESRRAGFQVVFDGPERLAESRDDAVAIGGGQGLAAMVAQADRALLGWLERGVERRYPDATVGRNPLAARALQFFPPAGWLLGTEIRSPLRSPVLMPYPYGIVIEEGVRIGRRVTLMQQVMLGRDSVVGDNACIGAGAKVLEGVSIGRGAVVAPNAVVAQDVPSHARESGDKPRLSCAGDARMS